MAGNAHRVSPDDGEPSTFAERHERSNHRSRLVAEVDGLDGASTVENELHAGDVVRGVVLVGRQRTYTAWRTDGPREVDRSGGCQRKRSMALLACDRCEPGPGHGFDAVGRRRLRRSIDRGRVRAGVARRGGSDQRRRPGGIGRRRRGGLRSRARDQDDQHGPEPPSHARETLSRRRCIPWSIS